MDMTLEERERVYVDAIEEVRNLEAAQHALRNGDTDEAAAALAEARRLRIESAPAAPVAVAAKLLKVSEPTIRSWLDAGILKDAGTKPRRVEVESVVRVGGLLAELREMGRDRDVRSALLARLDDELTLKDLRLKRSIKSMRRGRGERPVVAGSRR